MKFEETGPETGRTLLLLPGTACIWQINFAMVIDDLKERYHFLREPCPACDFYPSL